MEMLTEYKLFFLQYIMYFLTAHFLKVIERANQEPVKKYSFPQTEAQEYGWISRPLVSLFKPIFFKTKS